MENNEHTLEYDNPISDEKEYSESNKSNVTLPSVTHDTLSRYIKKLYSLDEDKFSKAITIKDAACMYLNTSTLDTSLIDNMLPISKKFTNNIKYADANLDPRLLSMNTANKELTSTAAVAKLSSILGLGSLAQIPLLHSGFWVTIRPFSDLDIINLEKSLSDYQLSLGRDTKNLIFSNYQVVFNRILTDFFIDHIENTSLKLDNNDDIRNYIKLQDLQSMILGLIITMYPEGYDLIRTCSNSVVLDENTQPECNYIVEAKIDPKKMLWRDYTKLTTEHLKIIAKKTPDSVDIDDITEYQSTLPINQTKAFEYTVHNDAKIKIYFKTPTLLEHIEYGEYWVEYIIKISQELFLTSSTNEDKENIVARTTTAVVLSIYNTFVDKIEFEDGSYITDKDDIIANLEVLSGDNDIISNFITDVKNYINDNTIAIVGIPNYTCPACSEEQNKDDIVNERFKEFIPINVIENFFALSALKTSKIEQRRIS